MIIAPEPREAVESNPLVSTEQAAASLRRVAARLMPGGTIYRIPHNLGTEDVIVQTRIAGRIREGGISISDANTVQVTFGGVLNEPMDVVIMG
jgi:hypothetical protein